MSKKTVYGIGNPLIDVIAETTEEEIKSLGIHKGTMQLTSTDQRNELVAFLKGKKVSYSCGGSCPNTMITLSALGVPTILAGKVGDDEYGRIYRTRLKELGVTDELRIGHQSTGSSIILITPDGERTMNTYLGANREFGPADVNKTSVEKAGYFHFTGYMWDTESQMNSIKTALEAAKRSNTEISFDVADPFAVGRYRETFLNLIAHDCDIVFANNDEARILFDNYDAYECCRSMGKLCRTAIVKNGKRGSFVCHKGIITAIPLQGPSSAVDTTGAGDTYAAGFLWGQANGCNVVDSAHIASFLAGEIISQIGAQFSKEKAEKLIDDLKNNRWKK